MSMVQCHQLHELQKKAGLIKGKKTPESSRALEARVAMLETKTDNSSNESLFIDEKPKAYNRNNPALDRKGNGTRADMISKEMNVRVAFKVLPNGKPLPTGNQFVQCHMVFDIKMEDLRHKARLVAGCHMTKTSATITCASIVSRETVRIALMIATLNDLEAK